MPESTVFDYEGCCLRFTMTQEQYVMPNTKSYHDIQLCFFTVEDSACMIGLQNIFPGIPMSCGFTSPQRHDTETTSNPLRSRMSDNDLDSDINA